MPHATSPRKSQEEQDDILIQLALDPENALDFSRDLEPGEKADDAIDFGDLGDDDLADDDEENNVPLGPVTHTRDAEDSFGDQGTLLEDGSLPLLTYENDLNADGDELEDLFGDAISSPINVGDETREDQLPTTSDDVDIPYTLGDVASRGSSILSSRQPREDFIVQSRDFFRPVAFSSDDTALSKEQQLQQDLFAMSNSGPGMTDTLPFNAQYSENQIASIWPKFERNTILRFMDLIPHKIAHFTGKKPVKAPKPVHPTRLSLEVAPDQEKNFRLPSSSRRTKQEDMDQSGLVTVQRTSPDERHIDHSLEIGSDSEYEPVGGVTWQDLQLVCEDWEYYHAEGPQSQEENQDPWIGTYEDRTFGLDQETKDHQSRHLRKVRITQAFKVFSSA